MCSILVELLSFPSCLAKVGVIFSVHQSIFHSSCNDPKGAMLCSRSYKLQPFTAMLTFWFGSGAQFWTEDRALRVGLCCGESLRAQLGLLSDNTKSKDSYPEYFQHFTSQSLLHQVDVVELIWNKTPEICCVPNVEPLISTMLLYSSPSSGQPDEIM